MRVSVLSSVALHTKCYEKVEGMSMAKASDNGLEVAESLKRLSSIHVTAQRLGVSLSSVRRLIANGQIGHIRIGRIVAVSECQLLEFLVRSSKGPA